MILQEDHLNKPIFHHIYLSEYQDSIPNLKSSHLTYNFFSCEKLSTR